MNRVSYLFYQIESSSHVVKQHVKYQNSSLMKVFETKIMIRMTGHNKVLPVSCVAFYMQHVQAQAMTRIEDIPDKVSMVFNQTFPASVSTVPPTLCPLSTYRDN